MHCSVLSTTSSWLYRICGRYISLVPIVCPLISPRLFVLIMFQSICLLSFIYTCDIQSGVKGKAANILSICFRKCLVLHVILGLKLCSG